MGRQPVQLENKILVFTTKREIREFKKGLPSDTFLPKIYPIGEFFTRIVVVPGKKFIDPSLRTYYLYKVVENIPIKRLGLPEEFLSFFKNSALLTSFFREVVGERVSWEQLEQLNIYGEYQEHLAILRQIFENYRQLLESHQLVDPTLLLPGEYQLLTTPFEGVKFVEIGLKGYLTRFERELLSQIPVPVKIRCRVTDYNRPLVLRMFGQGLEKEGDYLLDFHSGTVEDFNPLPVPAKTELYLVGSRLEQVEFTFGAIEQLVNAGISPEKIGIILPEESFKTYLKKWDFAHNLNFAMGWKIAETPFFAHLTSLQNYLENGDQFELEVAGELVEQFSQLKNWRERVEWVAQMGEEKLQQIPGFNKTSFRETIFKLLQLEKWFQELPPATQLYTILEQIGKVELDDVSGGKITVMGVLESRGADLEGVVVVDFNQGKVPKVEEQDYFLNSFIRQQVGLPTQQEKEALQKGFYFDLILNSKKVLFSFIKNEREQISRFAYQLKLGEPKPNPYRLFPKTTAPVPINYWNRPIPIPKILTPTALKNWLECPLKYYFKYVERIEPPEEERFNFGKIFHKVMEELLREFKEKRVELREWEDYFRELDARIVGYCHSPIEKVEYWERYLKQVKKFAKRDWKFIKSRNFEVEYNLPSVEIEIGVKCGNIVAVEKGNVIGYLTDHSTTGNSTTGNSGTGNPTIGNSATDNYTAGQPFTLHSSNSTGQIEWFKVEIGARVDRIDSVALYDYKTGSTFRPKENFAQIAVYRYLLLNSPQICPKGQPSKILFWVINREEVGLREIDSPSLPELLQQLSLFTTPPKNRKQACRYCPYKSLCLI